MPYFQQSDQFSIVHTARNGIEALEYLRNGQIDVVVTDIRMPLMGGIELLKIIQRERLCSCTVLLSEFAEFSYAKEGIINGAFDYLVKPVGDAMIRATFGRIYRFLQRSRIDLPPDPADLEPLVHTVICGTQETLAATLTECVQKIRRSAAGEASELRIRLQGLLTGIRDGIHTQLPYAALYVPLSQICSLDQPSASPDEQIECFTERAMLLQRELEKLRLKSQHPLVRKVWHYTLQNIEGRCRLQEISEKFFVNKNYLSTLFKRETGVNYKEFVIKFKIERAKMLLAYSDLKIYNIAETLQFGDAEYFGRIFKAQTGVPPGKFDYGAYLGIGMRRAQDIGSGQEEV